MGLTSTVRLEAIVIDCQNATMLGRWWAEALEWQCSEDQDGDIEVFQPDRHPPSLFFLANRDQKVAKNRLHLDFRGADQQAAVDRFLARGASRIDIGQGDASWIVLADPEGNEFCVLESQAR
ncbi:VOC family protein [Mycobacterium sp. CBMA271]|uniref:VOC family protein n=1 Tax=unclassified Mycobacteroides TaxID=2618759 RepID=UPI0012DD43B6|nr:MULTISPECIES: VOC family protein [unclassified Mycobacteroides]MUM19964.1 glyoxalase [Mycobacteroides sp. CBMA 326]MUM20138.1 VOC family protein [Mycobacteroides sp. CBMA 271]